MSSVGSSVVRTSSEESDHMMCHSPVIFECSSSDFDACSDSSAGSEFEYTSNSEEESLKMKNPFSFGQPTTALSETSSNDSSTSSVDEQEKLVNVNVLLKSLQKLQIIQSAIEAQVQMEREKCKRMEEEMIKGILAEVEDMKERVLAHLTTRSRTRILNSLNEQISAMTEIPMLLGRCFNLSLNIKIIGPSFAHGYIDSTIGARIVSDILILEHSLKSMQSPPEELKRSKAMNNLLSGLRIEGSRPKLGFF
eukprot:maker-scaffold37_size504123-snap-gene-2.15 protein:Tk07371 transcript:maker-scaffold37_size504123-snap-gene-2.15-mRNA-1 annotation:"hypothetical protein ACD_16C00038G0009"